MLLERYNIVKIIYMVLYILMIFKSELVILFIHGNRKFAEHVVYCHAKGILAIYAFVFLKFTLYFSVAILNIYLIKSSIKIEKETKKIINVL